MVTIHFFNPHVIDMLRWFVVTKRALVVSVLAKIISRNLDIPLQDYIYCFYSYQHIPSLRALKDYLYLKK